jgi:hypothetical protein
MSMEARDSDGRTGNDDGIINEDGSRDQSS